MVSAESKGGAQRVACQVASGLSESFNVLLLFGTGPQHCFPLSDKVVLRHFPKLLYDPFEIIKCRIVKTLKKRLRIDVSISLLLSMNRINLKTRQGERVIVSERNNPAIAYPETFSETKRIYKKADHVVFQTHEVQSLYEPEIQAHSSVLPNPVSIQTLSRPETAKKRIVNVARLHKNKNQEMLIRAFARFLPLHPDYTLSFYGDGSLRKALQILVESLGIQDKVFFHGNAEDVHKQIADAACFVLSSNVEGMPNALLEAMMMGLPCISTNCTGAKEVIRSGWNGLLVERGDENGLLAWTAKAFEDAGVTPNVFDDTDGWDYEAISDCNPDVILAAYSGLSQEEYDRLSEIAPVVAYPEIAWTTTWQEEAINDAKALGLEKEGKELVEETEKLIADKLSQYPDLAGKRVAFAWLSEDDLGTFYIYTNNDPRAAFLSDLGFVMPDSVKSLITSDQDFSIIVSAENADLLNDVDIIITYGTESLVEAMQADGRFANIPAVKDGAFVLLDSNDVLAAASTPTVLSIPYAIDDYLKALNDAAQKIQ